MLLMEFDNISLAHAIRKWTKSGSLVLDTRHYVNMKYKLLSPITHVK